MTRKHPPGLFITGTDTDVGKTYVTAMIARSLVAAGHAVGVYKPVASGCHEIDGLLFSDDALTLWEVAGRPETLEHVCPQRFTAPLAPHLAARAEGRTVDAELLRSGVEYWRQRSDIVLVEGAGGLMSPISDHDYVADLAADLGYPLIVVAANRIGVINQVLQTLIVAETYRSRGLRVAGVVLNSVELRPDDPSVSGNATELSMHMRSMWGRPTQGSGHGTRRDAVSLLTTVAYCDCEFAETIDWHSVAVN